MPAKYGTIGLPGIYNSSDKIGKIYKGLDLVYTSGDSNSTIKDTDTIKCFVSYNAITASLRVQYSKNTDTTAVEGSSYAIWDVNTQSMTPISVSAGSTLPSKSYKLNSSYTEDEKVPNMVYIIDFVDNFSLPNKLILNNDDLGIYDGVKYNVGRIDFGDISNSNVTDLECYNFPASETVPMASTDHGKISFSTDPINISKILLKDAHLKFTTGVQSTSIGSNVPSGVDIVIKGNSYTTLYSYMLGKYLGGNKFVHEITGGGVFKIKSLTFNTPNLIQIEDYAINVPYANINTSGVPIVEVPSTVKNIGSDNTALHYCSSINDPLFRIKIKDSSKIWNSINTTLKQEINPTFDSDAIGISGVTYTNTLTGHGYTTNLIIPSNVKYISTKSINSSGYNANITLNSTLQSFPHLYGNGTGKIFVETNPIINSVTIGSSVSMVPPYLFEGSSTFKGGITFNTPSNTNISIGEKAFYYKSARAVNISYNAPNTSISGYDWSGNQNITATFVEL